MHLSRRTHCTATISRHLFKALVTMFSSNSSKPSQNYRPDSDRAKSRTEGLLSNLRRYFLRGLAIIIPMALTIWVLWFIFQIIDGIASPLYQYIGLNIPGIGFITAVILIFLLGFFSRNFFVTLSFRIIERIFLNLPLAKSVYSGARELINAFSPGDRAHTFQKVCLIEYPRKGVYSIGFMTNELSFKSEAKSRGDTQAEQISAKPEDESGAPAQGDKKLTNVYIPLPPNPTTGMLTLVPSEDVIPLDLSVEQGMKLILSAGIVTPSGLSASR